MPEITPEWHVLLVQIISFLLTLWVMKKLAWVPIMNILASREDEIKGDYEKADTARKEMEGLRQEYQQRIAAADAEARQKIAAAMQKAEGQAAEVMTEAQQKAEALQDRARTEVERERAKAVLELRGQVGHLSVAIAGKIIGESLDEAKHQSLVDDFISQVGALS